MVLPIPRPVLVRVGDVWVSGIIVKAFQDESGQWYARVVWRMPKPPPFTTYHQIRPYTDLRRFPDS